jgi:cytoskeletal protein CcmA (bactofilin family)
MQNGLDYQDNYLDKPYPAIKFSTDGAAAVKVWWVAGDANRPLTIQTEQNGGGASIDVSSEIRVHGTGHFYNSLNVEGHVNVGEEVRADGSVYVGGDLEVEETARINNDLHVNGFISCGESLNMNENDIKNAQTITVKGTSTLLGDVKVKNNANRDYTVKLRDVLDEALDYSFKSRVYVNEMPGTTFTERLQNAINTVDDGGVVCIPYIEGLQYELDTRIDITAKSVKLLGIGKERPVINFTSGYVHFAVDGYCTGFALERLAMNCDSSYSNAVIEHYSDGDNTLNYSIVDCQFINTKVFMHSSGDINGDVNILWSKIYGVNDYPNIIMEGLNNLTIIDSYLDGGNSSDGGEANIIVDARTVRLENCHIIGYSHVLEPGKSTESLMAINCIVDVYDKPLLFKFYESRIPSVIMVGGNLGMQLGYGNGDRNPISKVITQVDLEAALSNIEHPTELYLMSPGGLKFKITVNDVGILLTEQVTE